MNLRYKLIIPLFLLVFLIMAAIHFFWLPNYLLIQKERSIKNESDYIEVFSTALTPSLIGSDLAQIYGTLDEVLKERDNWKAIRITDGEGIVLYPAFEIDPELLAKYIRINYEIMLTGDVLARVEVWVDIDLSVSFSSQQVETLEILLLIMLTITSMIIAFFQDRWVVIPINQLSYFSKRLASGNYDETMTYASEDEVGELVSAFNTMSAGIQEREKSIQSFSSIQETVRQIQDTFIKESDHQNSFLDLNDIVLNFTKSESGFIGEILYDNNVPYIKTFCASRLFFENESIEFFRTKGQGLELRELKTLYGEVIITGEVVISNDPFNDDRCSKTLPFENFLGLPLYSGRTLVGVVVVVNREGGYPLSFIDDLQVLLHTLGNLIVAYREKNELVESEKRYRSVVNNAIEGIISTNDKGIVEAFNPGAERMLGFSKDQVIGQSIRMFIPELEDDEYENNDLLSAKKGTFGIDRQILTTHRNGSRVPVSLSVSTFKSKNGHNKFTGILHDISERKRHEVEIKKAYEELSEANKLLEKISTTDSLTGIANRRYFDTTLQDEISRNSRLGAPLVLMLCDIDYFKKYNDHYGHQQGDSCLKEVAQKIASLFNRAGDLVARYGGEEFAIILTNNDEKTAKELALKVCRAVEEMALEHKASDVADHVTMSIGITVMVPENKTPEDFIKQADKALYSAKESGRNNVKMYTERKPAVYRIKKD